MTFFAPASETSLSTIPVTVREIPSSICRLLSSSSDLEWWRDMGSPLILLRVNLGLSAMIGHRDVARLTRPARIRCRPSLLLRSQSTAPSSLLTARPAHKSRASKPNKVGNSLPLKDDVYDPPSTSRHREEYFDYLRAVELERANSKTGTGTSRRKSCEVSRSSSLTMQDSPKEEYSVAFTAQSKLLQVCVPEILAG